MWRRLLPILIPAALALAGCQPAPEAELRIGTNVWPGYEPLYLARSLGRLPEGVRLIEYPASTETMRALRNAAIEAGALTLDEVLTLRAEGVDVRVVLVMDESAGADAVLARPDIATLADLKGKRLGAETTALGAWMTRLLLDRAGLTPADVRIVPLPVDEQEQAFRQGRVDALVTFEPVRSRLLETGAHVLFDSRETPGQIVDVLAVRGEALRTHSQHLHALLRAWFDTLDDMRRHPGESARRIAPRLRLPPGEIPGVFAGLHFPDPAQNHAMLADGGRLARTAQAMQQAMREAGLIRLDPRRALALTTLLDASFLPASRGGER